MEKASSSGVMVVSTRVAGTAANRAALATILTNTAFARRASGLTAVDSAGWTRAKLPHSSRSPEQLKNFSA